jgi:uncharacterized protein YraI
MLLVALALAVPALPAAARRAELQDGQGAVARSKVALRERPGPDYRVVARLDAGTPVTIERVKGEWVKVKAGGRTGWAPANLLEGGRSPRTHAGKPEAEPRRRKAAFVTDGQFARRSDGGGARERSAGKRVREHPPDTISDEDTAPDATEDSAELLPAKKAARWKQGRPKAAKSEADADESPASDSGDEASARSAGAADEEAPAEKAAGSGAGGRKVAAVTRTPVLRSPSGTAQTIAVARRGDEMRVLRQAQNGRWLLVEVDGERGWVESAGVRTVGQSVDEGVGAPVAGRQGGAIALSAHTGFVSMSQSFDSDADAFLGKYRIASAAGTIGLGGLYSYVSRIWEYAADGSYRFTAATPGVEVTTMAGQREDLAVIQHTLDLGARLGYRSPDGMRLGLYGRLGYHMDALKIDQSKLAPLPSETISGVTIGAGLDLPGLSQHLSARATVDVLAVGSRDQTIGLRDGTDDGTNGLFIATTLGYRFGEAWAADGGYQLSYLATSFKGPSERLQNRGTWGARTNLDHMLLVGLTYSR